MRQLSPPIDSICPPVRRCEPKRRARVTATSDLLAHAQSMILALGCTLLLIERSVRVGGTSIRIDAVFPDGSRSKGVARSGDPAMRAVCQAANLVLRQIAAMVPEGLDDCIGLMTDGTGAVFSPECPSVMDAGWLGAVLVNAVEATELAPFDADERWGRLAAMQHGGRAH